jgi:hypothetical protein
MIANSAKSLRTRWMPSAGTECPSANAPVLIDRASGFSRTKRPVYKHTGPERPVQIKRN